MEGMEKTVALEGERQQLIHEVTVLRGQVGQIQPAPAGGPASSTPTTDTKVIGTPVRYNGDPTRFGATSGP